MNSPAKKKEGSVAAPSESTLELLESIAADRTVLDHWPEEERARLHKAIASIYHPEPKLRRKKTKELERERHQEKLRRADALLDQTGIRTLRRAPVFTTPNYFPPTGFIAQDRVDEAPEAIESPELRHCYVCKNKFTLVHHFYDQMCPECAEFNFFKRTELADLTGRVALLTGGRVKIGYQAGLKLLRAGAQLIVTTRFARDSAARYANEPDFEQWAHRLEIFGLDLRHTPSVEAFCRELSNKTYDWQFVPLRTRPAWSRTRRSRARRSWSPSRDGSSRRCGSCAASSPSTDRRC